MPAGLIKDENCVRARSDPLANLVEMKLHGFCVASRQHEGGAGSELRAMRKRRIAGSRSAVWRFFVRHNISFKKKPARRGAAASGCGPRTATLDARTRHV